MTSFDLEDVDLGSPNLHHKEFLCGPTHPQSFVFLAFLGAEIAGGGAEYAPPSRARNSQTLSRDVLRLSFLNKPLGVCIGPFKLGFKLGNFG